MRLLVAAVLLCLGFAAQAATVTVSWTNPTQNSDGSALPASAITRTTVVWGVSSTTLVNSKVVAGAATSTTIDLGPGTWFVAARTTANGNDSALSNIAQKIVPQPTPNPPVITVSEVVAGVSVAPAYKILASGSRSSTVAGFVPVGTACVGPVVYRYRGKGYRRVARADVKWWATTATDAIAAPCG